MTPLQTLTLTWKGEAVTFKPTFDLFMRIEERLSFSRLSDSYRNAFMSEDGHLDMPLSHLSWVIYQCLREGGVLIRNIMEVHQELTAAKIQYGGVLSDLIIAYYGARPEKLPAADEKKTESQTDSLRSTSTNDIGPP